MMNVRPALIRGLAAIDHDGKCDTVLVNPVRWLFLTEKEKSFITAHEYAHCAYGVHTEEEADRIGLSLYTQAGGDPQDAVQTLANNLDMSIPINRGRVQKLQRSYCNPSTGSGADPYSSDINDAPEDHSDAGTERDEAKWSPEQWTHAINAGANAIGQVGDLLGRSGGGRSQTYLPPDEEEEESNPALWLGIGVAVLVVIMIIAKVVTK